MSIINTIHIGRTGLKAAAYGIEVAGQNVTNAGTEGYVRRRLVQQFELSEERSQLLGAVLVNYEQDLARVRDQQTARSMETMEPELRELGGRYWKMIRERVIPPNSRSEFDSFAAQNLVVLQAERES